MTPLPSARNNLIARFYEELIAVLSAQGHSLSLILDALILPNIFSKIQLQIFLSLNRCIVSIIFLVLLRMNDLGYRFYIL